MTLNEFNALSIQERQTTITGLFLADRRVAGQTAALYSVGNFFVEVWYDGGRNELTLMAAFDSPGLLEPYLSLINIGV